MPVYNVERYLRECLESIAVQAVADIEVIVVDDGSTDDGPSIAESFARGDPRFRVLRQANHGLGHARNTGARHARGELLAFADSDDVVTPHGYELLVSQLERSGSDFASGNVRRLTGAGTTPAEWLQPAFATTRTATHVTRDRTLLLDRVIWNKVFRRSFWDAHGFRFPEGVLYEDIPVALPAHFLARSVDIVEDTVYLWRRRRGGERSITQQRLDPGALRDRVTALEQVHRFIAAHAEPLHRRWFAEISLASDLRGFMALLPRADDGYRAAFIDIVGGYLDAVGPGACDALPALDRLCYQLVRQRDMHRLLTVLELDHDELHAVPVVRRDGGCYARYPYFEDPAAGVPSDVYRIDAELELRTGVADLRWEAGALHVDAHAYIDRLDLADEAASEIRLHASPRGTAERHEIALTRVPRPEVTREAGEPLRRYAWSGFAAVIDPDRLPATDAAAGRWRFEVEVVTGGVRRSGPLVNPARGRATRGQVLDRPDGTRLRATVVAKRGLSVSRRGLPVTLTAHEHHDGVLLLSGATSLPLGPAATLRLTKHRGGKRVARVVVPVAGDTRGWRAEVALGALGALGAEPDVRPTAVWRVALAVADRRRPVPVAFPAGGRESRHLRGEREVTVRGDRRGRVVVVDDGAPRPLAQACRWEGDELRIEGAWGPAGATAGELVLRGRRHGDQRSFALQRADGRFRAAVAPGRVHSLAGELPLPAGGWDVMVRGGRDEPLQPLLADRALVEQLPAAHVVAHKAVDVDESSGRLRMRVGSDLAPEETGRYAQYALQTTTYPQRRSQPLLDVVLYQSFGGKQYSDSPRAIHEEMHARDPGLEQAWVVRDGQVALPQTARAVRRASRDHYELMARARLVIVNNHLPQWFRRREGQVVLQTWHGSALKRIGLDIEQVHFANERYQQQLRSETAQWTWLISPSPSNSPIMARAFACEGRLLETGYPRNDLLHRPDRQARADAVRRRLGLPADHTVVLYAPTWRDDRFSGRGGYRLDLRLDLAAARRALGADHVLLVRRHPNVVDALPGSGDDFVRDVSSYPDMGELLLIADVLVTDYSAVMFDFVQTGRPILFFTYDLEHYRDTLRGFYFDFEARAPGPLLRTSEEVIAAIRDAPAVRAGYDRRYRDFVADFTPWDDGHAARRVVDALLAHTARG